MSWVWYSDSHCHKKNTLSYMTKKYALLKRGVFYRASKSAIWVEKVVFVVQNPRKVGVFRTWAWAWYRPTLCLGVGAGAPAAMATALYAEDGLFAGRCRGSRRHLVRCGITDNLRRPWLQWGISADWCWRYGPGWSSSNGMILATDWRAPVWSNVRGFKSVVVTKTTVVITGTSEVVTGIPAVGAFAFSRPNISTFAFNFD